jgi:hypothetical protein
MVRLVIKGAYYYDDKSDTILMPHFTGEFHTVDCTQYVLKKELKKTHSSLFIKEHKDYKITFDGKDYYYSEYSPWCIDNWELLSDLSDLQHEENSFNF